MSMTEAINQGAYGRNRITISLGEIVFNCLCCSVEIAVSCCNMEFRYLKLFTMMVSTEIMEKLNVINWIT